MKKIRNNRFLSLLLAIVLVLGLAPMFASIFTPVHIHAGYEDGQDCIYCGSYRYDDWLCDGCGGCSENASGNCYSDNHCPECGNCRDFGLDHCGNCFRCEECIDICSNCELCTDCGAYGIDYLCESCGQCAVCAESGWCPGCDYCGGCNGGSNCANEDCMLCADCYESRCYICEYCSECTGMGEVACPDCWKCAFCQIDEGAGCYLCHRCADCANELCSECNGVCSDCADAFCDEHKLCSLCIEFVSCCENYCMKCVEDLNLQLCINCGNCEDCSSAFCENCGFCDSCADICVNCGESCSECAEVCSNCGYCENCVDAICECGNYCSECADNFCYTCQKCSDCVDVCPSCGDYCSECAEVCGNCSFCENCVDVICECGNYCSECADMFCYTCQKCSDCVDVCPNCGDYCSECAEVCGNCSYCENCADICEDCGDYCSECDYFCPQCGLCGTNCTLVCIGCQDTCINCADGFCENCEKCSDCTEICPSCGNYCNECAEVCGDCGYCEYCEDICVNCGDHCSNCALICGSGCGECEYCVKICVTCGMNCEYSSIICPECGKCDECSSLYNVHYHDEHDHWYKCDCGWIALFNNHRFENWIIDRPATATEDGEKSRKCIYCPYTEYEIIPANHTHIPSDWIVDKEATTDKNGSKHIECTICGEILDTETIPATGSGHVHVFSGDWSSNSMWHWHECGCGSKTGINTHTVGDWIVDTPAAAKTEGSKHRECTVCGYVMGTKTIPATGFNHKHKWADTWSTDTTNHWLECSCGEKKNFAPHTAGDWIADTPATETTEGSKHKECTVCGYVMETGVIPTTGPDHVHQWAEVWSKDTANHWHECSCGERKDIASHSVSNWIVDTPATTKTEGSKYKECTVCGYITETAVIPARSGSSGGGGDSTVDVKNFTLAFDTNGGSAIASLSRAPNSKIDLSAYKPIRVGYIFDGWFENSALTKAITSVTLEADTTVYAKWTAKETPKETTLPFVDVNENDWFYTAVEYVHEEGLMSGTGDTKFDPHGATTRGMIVTMLYRLENKPDVGTENPFTDVTSDKWYADAVIWAAETGIVNGYGNGKFGPEDAITREQMAAILMNYAKLKGYDTSAKADLSKFSDVATVSDWAMDAMAWANAENLIQGDGTKLMPTGNAERCHVAAILQRFVENITK